jgi:hypothetical protein
MAAEALGRGEAPQLLDQARLADAGFALEVERLAAPGLAAGRHHALELPQLDPPPDDFAGLGGLPATR